MSMAPELGPGIYAPKPVPGPPGLDVSILLDIFTIDDSIQQYRPAAPGPVLARPGGRPPAPDPGAALGRRALCVRADRGTRRGAVAAVLSPEDLEGSRAGARPSRRALDVLLGQPGGRGRGGRAAGAGGGATATPATRAGVAPVLLGTINQPVLIQRPSRERSVWTSQRSCGKRCARSTAKRPARRGRGPRRPGAGAGRG